MLKWTKRILVTITLLALALLAALMATAQRSERPVGFQMVRGSVPGAAPFAVGIWYPTGATPRPTTLLGLTMLNVAPDAPLAGSKLPLIILSHGNGGGPGSHVDLAMALASAGFIVAAPMHNGDNYTDQSAVASASFVHGRQRQLREAVDFMLAGWSERDRIDRSRIGAYGFSAGALTVLTAVGVQADLREVGRHCATSVEFACEMFRKVKSPLLAFEPGTMGAPFVADVRIKAAVVAAPGVGFALTRESLAAVRIPVQLWHADADTSVPYETNARRVREGLGARGEFHLVPNAGHFAFLAPCALAGPPLLCADKPEFDRKSFHAYMNSRVIAFFKMTLPESA
ncbi:MAG: dienelactone hydrolase [Pseudomonadota bacterium]